MPTVGPVPYACESFSIGVCVGVKGPSGPWLEFAYGGTTDNADVGVPVPPIAEVAVVVVVAPIPEELPPLLSSEWAEKPKPGELVEFEELGEFGGKVTEQPVFCCPKLPLFWYGKPF